MTPADLIRIASTLYGSGWQTPLGAALGYSPRHLRRLAFENYPIPADMPEKLESLCTAKSEAIRTELKFLQKAKRRAIR